MGDTLRRRDFLRLGAAAGLAAGLARHARGQAGPKRVRLGFIGVGGRGTSHVRTALGHPAIDIPAVCDIIQARAAGAAAIVAKARAGAKPEVYTKGPFDYRRMLARDDLDGVVISTPMQLHGQMAIDALRAGKHVLSEVAAAVTVEECWGLVRATEQSGKVYMLAENCCYWRHLMRVLNMVRKGLFGPLTYAECGYVHDCRGLLFARDGALTWRGELARDFGGNVYPTHSLGPVAHWLGIGRGDRMVSLVAQATRSAALEDYAARRFPEGHPARKVAWKLPDSTNTLIRTAKGVLIDLRFDMCSPGTYNCYHNLQGLAGRSRSAKGGSTQEVWLHGKTKGWEPIDRFAEEFEHDKWKRWGEEAKRTGHGGADFFMIHEFVEAVRTGGPPPVDVYDAAAWSAIIPLSAKSVAEGGRPQPIPDFTTGKWKTRTG